MNTTATKTLNETITELLGNGLTEKVSIYVPSTVQANEEATILSITTAGHVSIELSRMFGGFTRHEATGGWVSDEHGLITESVTVISASTTKIDLQDNLKDVVKLAQWVKRIMSQEAVSVEVNGTLFFV